MPFYTFTVIPTNRVARLADASGSLERRRKSTGFHSFADWAVDQPLVNPGPELAGVGPGDLIIEVAWVARTERAARSELEGALKRAVPKGTYDVRSAVTRSRAEQHALHVREEAEFQAEIAERKRVQAEAVARASKPAKTQGRQ
jgi:hypothetical protein